jgi:hypothetical protein
MEVKTMRPELTNDLSINDFTDFYWLKTELQQFCRENTMSPSGSKMELSKRIEVFLTTGDTQQSKASSKRRSSSKTQAPLTLDTVITENH